MDCDVLLLTEVSERLDLPGYDLHLGRQLMAPKRRWAAIASRLSMSPQPDPHGASAMVEVGGCVSAPPSSRGGLVAPGTRGWGLPRLRRPSGLLLRWKRALRRSGAETGTIPVRQRGDRFDRRQAFSARGSRSPGAPGAQRTTEPSLLRRWVVRRYVPTTRPPPHGRIKHDTTSRVPTHFEGSEAPTTR